MTINSSKKGNIYSFQKTDKDKLFFITAKGSGKNAPLEAIELLSKNGLKIKAIDITSKRKICNCGKKNCNPDDCPFAIGYFSRLKAATYEIYKRRFTFIERYNFFVLDIESIGIFMIRCIANYFIIFYISFHAFYLQNII